MDFIEDFISSHGMETGHAIGAPVSFELTTLRRGVHAQVVPKSDQSASDGAGEPDAAVIGPLHAGACLVVIAQRCSVVVRPGGIAPGGARADRIAYTSEGDMAVHQ